MEKAVYTLKEVQALMGWSRYRTYEEVKDEKFPCIRNRRPFLVPKEAFYEWLKDQCR